MAKSHRFYLCPPDGGPLIGISGLKPAREAAREMGDGTLIVDTMAQTYRPMLQECRGGEIVYAGFGGWDTGKFGIDRDFIESIKKGNATIVQAFLAKGADVNAVDKNDGTALHWAVGGGKAEILRLLIGHGADILATDSYGQTALDLAKKKGRQEIIDLLNKALDALQAN